MDFLDSGSLVLIGFSLCRNSVSFCKFYKLFVILLMDFKVVLDNFNGPWCWLWFSINGRPVTRHPGRCIDSVKEVIQILAACSNTNIMVFLLNIYFLNTKHYEFHNSTITPWME
jgi:hypothetical protein